MENRKQLEDKDNEIKHLEEFQTKFEFVNKKYKVLEEKIKEIEIENNQLKIGKNFFLINF